MNKQPYTLGSISIERPALITANQENLPTPDMIVQKGIYQIGDEQLLAVNLALYAFERNRKGFLLADGTGVGKTRQILVIAQEYKNIYNKKVLIVTENEQIIKGSFTSDAIALGIDLDDFEVCTYRSITPNLKYKETIEYTNSGYAKKVRVIDKENSKPAKNGLKEYGLVIFDEAHNLKNEDSGKSIAALNIVRKHTLYATATPMDTITGLIYFVKEVTNFSEEEILNNLGLKIEEKIDEKGNIRRYIKLNNLDKKDPDYDRKAAIRQEQVRQNIIKLRNSLVSDGVMIRREYPFFGKITEIAIPLNDLQIQEEIQIDGYYQDKIDRILENIYSGEGGGNISEQLLRIGGERSNELSRWNEMQKINYVYQAVIKDYKDGKNVVVVAEGVNRTLFKGLDKESEQFLGTLAKKLERAGIDFAQVYGSGDKSKEVARFQNEKVKVLLATPQSGGTGINLDDSKGCCPRVMYVVTANYSGNVFQQILGRVSRRNTKTPAEVFLIYTDSISDKKRRQIVSKKIAILLAIQNGSEDIDAFTINESIEKNEENNEKTDKKQNSLLPSSETKAKNTDKENITNQKIKENLPYTESISEKAFVVKNSFAIKEELKKLGGKYLPKYAGWIFPNNKKELIDKFINQEKAVEKTKESIEKIQEVRENLAYRRLNFNQFKMQLNIIKDIISKKKPRFLHINFTVREVSNGFYVDMSSIKYVANSDDSMKAVESIIKYFKSKNYIFRYTGMSDYEGIFEFIEDVNNEDVPKKEITDLEKVAINFIEWAKENNNQPIEKEYPIFIMSLMFGTGKNDMIDLTNKFTATEVVEKVKELEGNTKPNYTNEKVKVDDYQYDNVLKNEKNTKINYTPKIQNLISELKSLKIK